MARLRASLLVLLGTPVMAAILVAIPILAARMWGTALLDAGFWFGAAVFGGLSLVALGVILRARARVVRTGESSPSGMLARSSPVLMLIGAIAGALIAHRMAESGLTNHWEVVALDCRTLYGEHVALDDCMPVMERCDAETRGGDGIHTDRSGRLSVDWPAGLDVPDDPRTRAQYLCVWQALGEGGVAR